MTEAVLIGAIYFAAFLGLLLAVHVVVTLVARVLGVRLPEDER